MGIRPTAIWRWIVIQLGILKFILSYIFTDEERLRILIAGTCDANHEVVSMSEDGIKRWTNNVDLESSSCISSLYTMYLGTKGSGKVILGLSMDWIWCWQRYDRRKRQASSCICPSQDSHIAFSIKVNSRDEHANTNDPSDIRWYLWYVIWHFFITLANDACVAWHRRFIHYKVTSIHNVVSSMDCSHGWYTGLDMITLWTKSVSWCWYREMPANWNVLLLFSSLDCSNTSMRMKMSMDMVCEELE